ncbi:phosphopantetheine-binding protein [Sphingobacterium sp. ML3W]|uniref:phosphopantetheine-binding protein n=2 Tax=Sphingobacterium sp. ML3W TaxID=1538644 RepID=UPI00249C1F78|nr:phosphopantetheine-binding protein [Sphingobacterium sp. ML3W]WFA78749.1 phosphopantetheine-binding protein [Sphingobacterium sp. ML3W]
MPDPDEGLLGTGTEYVGARNAVESLLVLIWEEVLGRSGIGIHDNFFDLGGNSLKAMELSLLVRKKIDAKIDLRKLFLHADIESLAAEIDHALWFGKADNVKTDDENKTYISV